MTDDPYTWQFIWLQLWLIIIFLEVKALGRKLDEISNGGRRGNS